MSYIIRYTIYKYKDIIIVPTQKIMFSLICSYKSKINYYTCEAATYLKKENMIYIFLNCIPPSCIMHIGHAYLYKSKRIDFNF